MGAPSAVRLEHIAQHDVRVIRLLLPEEAQKAVDQKLFNAAFLTRADKNNGAVLALVANTKKVTIPVRSTPDLIRILEFVPQIKLTVQPTQKMLIMTGHVLKPEPTNIVLSGALKIIDLVKNPSSSMVQIPNLLSAIGQATAEKVNRALSGNQPLINQNKSMHLKEIDPQMSQELAQSVLRSIKTVGGRTSMLIPDISPAMPRPVAPDALPNQIPIRQQVADELGLKAGQVVQGLISSSGEKMALQLGNQNIPLPQGFKDGPGQLALRVINTAQGLALVPHQAQQNQAAQTLAATGLSSQMVKVLAKLSSRVGVHSLFAPGILESSLRAIGLSSEARLLANQRLSSKILTGEAIKGGITFGALGNEKALLEGVAMQGGLLKPWLRQLLKLLPQQSELTSRISGLVSELEGLQLESLPSQQRESGLSALLLFKDQSPVEMLFERNLVQEGSKIRKIWIINLYTSLEHLGPVWLKSSFDSNRVELTFWAANQNTATLARKSKLDLEEALSEQGLLVTSMQIFGQARPKSDFLSQTDFPRMDVKV